MSRARTEFRCTECGGGTPKWSGRCPACGEWNTLVEERAGRSPSGHSRGPAPHGGGRAVPIGQVKGYERSAQATGVGELDRVLGGGFVPGSVTLVGGEPGIGKSTLLLQMAAKLAHGGAPCLLVSAEESEQQVRLRAERLEAFSSDLWLLSETELPCVVAAVEQISPRFLVLDSVQAVFDPELASAPGSVSQVRECASQLVRLAKARNLATILVGHVTKDGALAGPRVLEHVVDTVLSFEGDRHHALRLLRPLKHRFGSTSELGLFEMTDGGLSPVSDPATLFLADRHRGVPGSVVVPTLDGRRPLVVEVQALTSPLDGGVPPRRWAQDVDPGRLGVLLAVLERRAGVSFSRSDVYAMAAGGVRVTEPGADLALGLALTSALCNEAVAPDVVACGEVGLGGEVRQVPHLGRRLAEAARLGFRRAVVPVSAPDPPAGIQLVAVATLREAIVAAGLERQAVRGAHERQGHR